MILVTTVKQIATLFVVALVVGIVASAAIAAHAHSQSSTGGHVGVNGTIKATCPVQGRPTRQTGQAAG